MSATHIISDCLPSLCQKLSDLVEVWHGYNYNQNNFACFLDTVYNITSHSNILFFDWIVQCFTSPPTQYRLYGRRFLQTCQKTQPTVSKYWRKTYKRQSKQRKQL